MNYRTVNMANAMRSLADHLQPLHISVATTHSGTYRQVVFSSVVGIRVQLFISMRIRIQVAKPMRIHPDSDPDPGQTSMPQKVEFLHEKCTYSR
jgi:hypothetical protein